MKKYKLSISVRKGMEERHFDSYEVSEGYTMDLFQISKLGTFKDDAYLVADIEEVPEPTEAE